MRHAALLIATLATLNTNLVAQTRPPAPADSIASEVRTIVLRMQAAVRENDRRALATLIDAPSVWSKASWARRPVRGTAWQAFRRSRCS